MQRIILLLIIVTLSTNPLIYAQSGATQSFLNTLEKTQQKKANLEFGDKSRETWHFFPGTMYKRSGVALYELNDSQKASVFNVLKNNLSDKGYKKTLKIIDLERHLGEITGNKEFRDPEKYYMAIYGNPKTDPLWSWSFEGHHISLNFTISNGKISSTPLFFGANPAEIKQGKQKGDRVLHKEEDLAFELMHSMTDAQKDKTIFNTKALPEIVTFNASKVEPLETVGIQAKALNKQQQAILMSIIKEYLSTIPNDLAKERLRAIRISEFDDIYFGWSGSTDISEGHYYRIQGDTFLIEFDNTQNNANHIHAVWRDFNGDFGRDLIKEHYANASHHR